jgi:hypothetical protein
MAEQANDVRVELIRMAQGLAQLGTAGGVRPQQVDRYLERFRAVYDHLAATVLTTPAAGRAQRRDASTPGWD